MALTDTFVKQAKFSGRLAGDKHSDGRGLYLHITKVGKYWRMAYRFMGKQKTLALGVYPAVTLAQAREGAKQARVLLAQDLDPSAHKQEARAAAKAMEKNTFEEVARDFH